MRHPSISNRAPRKSFRNNGGWWKIIITIILALAAIVAIVVLTSGCTPPPTTQIDTKASTPAPDSVTIKWYHTGTTEIVNGRDVWQTGEDQVGITIFHDRQAVGSPCQIIWKETVVDCKVGEQTPLQNGFPVSEAMLKVGNEIYDLNQYNIDLPAVDSNHDGVTDSFQITIQLP